MRLDKLTTKFQEALGEAQTLALGNDHAYIEPDHLLVAMLRQEDGPRALLQRAGVNVPGLLAGAEARHAQAAPRSQGQEQVQVGRDLVALLQAAEKEAIKRGDQFIAGELFLLARGRHQAGHRPHRPRERPVAQVAGIGDRRGARRPERGQPGSRRPARSAQEIHAWT